MAYKNKEDQQKAWRDHYSRNRERYAERNTKRKIEMREWLNSLKVDKPCKDCGNVFPAKGMDWHHRDPSTKEFQIGQAIALGYGRERILREIAKCDILCATCHRCRVV